MLNYGWAAGRVVYGAGLMIEQPMRSMDGPTSAPNFSQWGSYMGHGGDTYGFLSEQGIVGRLDNASFSLVSNQDYDGSFVTHAMACRTIVAAEVHMTRPRIISRTHASGMTTSSSQSL